MNALIERLVAGRFLSDDDTERVFSAMLAGELDEVRATAALVALRVRGESAAELAGAARALLASAAPFSAPPYPVADTCGTGGDGAGTINVSTAAAFVAAAAGLPVVKHGNRSVSSRCGSADVLEALGTRIDLDAAAARRQLDASGVAFLFAPRLHPGIARLMPVRRALGTRTIFNALGPLVNPARPAFQLLGVYDAALCAPVAETLGLLGCGAALVVHGAGLDEIALHGPTTAVRLKDGALEHLTLHPADFDLPHFPLAALEGGDAAHNALALRALLAGRGAYAHVAAVAANAGALLWIAGRARDPADGARQATEALENGAAGDHLAAFLEAGRDA